MKECGREVSSTLYNYNLKKKRSSAEDSAVKDFLPGAIFCPMVKFALGKFRYITMMMDCGCLRHND